MNDDYLWDKRGEPDPEILQLEEILGSLRYEPKSFEIPRDVPALRRRSYFPLLAIAATLLLALLAGGIWLRVRSRSDSQPQQAALPAPPAEKKEMTTGDPEKKPAPVEREEITVFHRKPHKRPSSSVLARREREEALAVKEQLMFALRLASEKLNLVHKKTQNTSPANQIKNQHRVG